MGSRLRRLGQTGLACFLVACTQAPERAALDDAGQEASATCPPSTPEPSTACATGATPCTYGDLCAPVLFTCTDGSWQNATPATQPAPPCPATLPANGDTCAPCASAYECRYDAACDREGGSAGIGTCAGGHFLVGAVDCED